MDFPPEVSLGRFCCRRACVEDLEVLAGCMRDEDVREIAASDGLGPLEVLRGCFSRSDFVMAGFFGGEILCVWGVWGGVLDGIYFGAPWLLGSRLMDDGRVRRGFLRLSKFYLGWVQERYGCLWNLSDARNVRSHRWLGWLGFEFGEAVCYGVEDRDFVPFFLGPEGSVPFPAGG